MFSGLLTVTVFTPVVGALLVAILGSSHRRARAIAAIAGTLLLALSIIVFSEYALSKGGVRLVDYAPGWLPFEALKSQYLLGVDGLSAPLVLLTGLLGFVAVFASMRVEHRVREYFFWLLLLLSAVMGSFVALDLLLFFVFFEFEVFPMFMLISIWGSGRKVYSATKFALFTLGGGAFMLVGILMVFLSHPIDNLAMLSIPSMGIVGIPDQISAAGDALRLAAPAALIFAFFLIAFAIKLPLWPLHNWLPDAHTDAPTAVSVVLAGVLLKMAGYGLFRINLGFFLDTPGLTAYDVAGILAWVAAGSVIYGAIVTIRQTDLKRLIAYSSISHMGFVMLGLTAFSSLGLTGAALQMFSHGTITGLAFLMTGLLYEKVHTRHIPHLGGLGARLPILTVFFMLAGLASLGLPLLSGFVSEIAIFWGTFSEHPWQTGIAAFGVVLAAGYILWMAQRIFFGTRPTEEGLDQNTYDNLQDLKLRDLLPIVPLAAAIVVVGVWPSVLFQVIENSVLEIFIK